MCGGRTLLNPEIDQIQKEPEKKMGSGDTDLLYIRSIVRRKRTWSLILQFKGFSMTGNIPDSLYLEHLLSAFLEEVKVVS